MNSVLNTFSEYAYFYISKNITSYTLVAYFDGLLVHSSHAVGFYVYVFAFMVATISLSAQFFQSCK